MSMSTYRYLCKYNLLREESLRRSPLAPVSENRYGQRLPGETKILDEDLIKRMPKL